MEIVFNKLSDAGNGANKLKPQKQAASTWAQRQRYKNYQKSLKKYAAEIAEIQKSWPGWLPKMEI